MAQDFEALTHYAKSFSGLTPELETILLTAGAEIKLKLPMITEQFYRNLSALPEAATFIDGRVDALKETHLRWMESLFSGPYDQTYVEQMYKIGYVHVRIKLPVEFIASAMTMINNRLNHILVETYGSDLTFLAKVLEAVGAVTGMSLLLMQKSFQTASSEDELETFLQITGMSRALFNNLASSYQNTCFIPKAPST